MTDPQHEETFADTERKLREIITTLRAQLAEAREVSEADKIAIRNKALREAAGACDWGDIYGDNAVRTILALITEGDCMIEKPNTKEGEPND